MGGLSSEFRGRSEKLPHDIAGIRKTAAGAGRYELCARISFFFFRVCDHCGGKGRSGMIRSVSDRALQALRVFPDF